MFVEEDMLPPQETFYTTFSYGGHPGDVVGL
jgi:hypothetical protein